MLVLSDKNCLLWNFRRSSWSTVGMFISFGWFGWTWLASACSIESFLFWSTLASSSPAPFLPSWLSIYDPGLGRPTSGACIAVCRTKLASSDVGFGRRNGIDVRARSKVRANWVVSSLLLGKAASYSTTTTYCTEKASLEYYNYTTHTYLHTSSLRRGICFSLYALGVKVWKHYKDDIATYT